MASLESFITKNKNKIFAGFTIVTFIGGYLYFKQRQRQKAIEKCKEKWKSESYDKVVLHLLPPAKNVLNHSPFNIKLEALCRLCKIPYINHYGITMSPKQKQSPWIYHRGKAIGDTQLIYQYIMENKNKFKEFKDVIDPDINLTDKEKAISHSFRIMLEDGLFFVLRYLYFILHSKEMVASMEIFKNKLIINKMASDIYKIHEKVMYHQGLGRHSEETIFEIGTNQINAIFDYMGDNKFFFGDNITSIDCIIYAFLSCIYYSPFEWKNKSKQLPKQIQCKQYLKRIEKALFPETESCQTYFDQAPKISDQDYWF